MISTPAARSAARKVDIYQIWFASQSCVGASTSPRGYFAVLLFRATLKPRLAPFLSLIGVVDLRLQQYQHMRRLITGKSAVRKQKTRVMSYDKCLVD
jgi:hypothetical protein